MPSLTTSATFSVISVDFSTFLLHPSLCCLLTNPQAYEGNFIGELQAYNRAYGDQIKKEFKAYKGELLSQVEPQIKAQFDAIFLVVGAGILIMVPILDLLNWYLFRQLLTS